LTGLAVDIRQQDTHNVDIRQQVNEWPNP
jgi:hypothetical protein